MTTVSDERWQELTSPGYFLEPAHAWFDPIYAQQGLGSWQPQIDWSTFKAAAKSATSATARERRIERGDADAFGTMPMGNTPIHGPRPKNLTVQRGPTNNERTE